MSLLSDQEYLTATALHKHLRKMFAKDNPNGYCGDDWANIALWLSARCVSLEAVIGTVNSRLDALEAKAVEQADAGVGGKAFKCECDSISTGTCYCQSLPEPAKPAPTKPREWKGEPLVVGQVWHGTKKLVAALPVGAVVTYGGLPRTVVVSPSGDGNRLFHAGRSEYMYGDSANLTILSLPQPTPDARSAAEQAGEPDPIVLAKAAAPGHPQLWISIGRALQAAHDAGKAELERVKAEMKRTREEDQRTIGALLAERDGAREVSEGRRVTLMEVRQQQRAEWKRAENAEADRDQWKRRAEEAEKRGKPVDDAEIGRLADVFTIAAWGDIGERLKEYEVGIRAVLAALAPRAGEGETREGLAERLYWIYLGVTPSTSAGWKHLSDIGRKGWLAVADEARKQQGEK